MTRKDYILIAEVIRQHSNAQNSFNDQQLVLSLARKLATALGGAYPNFNYSRFMDHCQKD